jgi:hypothetical protein
VTILASIVRRVTEVSVLWACSIKVSFGLLECTAVTVRCQRGLAVILQYTNGSNGLPLHKTICIVTNFNIDLLQSSTIALLAYGHSSQHFGWLSRHVGVYVMSVLGST